MNVHYRIEKDGEFLCDFSKLEPAQQEFASVTQEGFYELLKIEVISAETVRVTRDVF